ncbi:TonB-dependent receptor [Sphingomonas lenta]|uniref:TonB-dependent receptor n=1 Tax=Sphingomonas lenta TaxID=1141887 RepID=A0A2A2SCA0_9SPHN|nr:TonB-dependent receptor [Sphingomonas lenta]PAX06886.1 TonB-dependent receptor [Sphingomonas lenta]
MVVTLSLLLSAAPLQAQQPTTPPVQEPTVQEPATEEAETDAEASEGEEIVVTGQREPGSVAGDIPPLQQIRPAEIRSYGVNTVEELLAELGPQTRSGRGGPPVVLVNGRRVSGFQEIRDIPTEAILRVDVLPEEVALRYGYRADQRVVNFVLRRRFRAVTAEADARVATEGGRVAPEAEVDFLTIRRDERLNLHLEGQFTDALTESERNVLSRNGDGSSGDPLRTLLPENRTVSTNAVYARPIGNVQASVNGQLEISDSTALFGAGLDGLALQQDSRTISGRLGTTLNGDIGSWRWNFTGAYDISDSETFTDVEGFAPNRADAVSSQGNASLLLNGTAFELPAGNISTSVRVGGSTLDFESRSFRFGNAVESRVSRDVGGARGNIDVPIASRSRDVLPFLGQLSVNANAEVERLSDFGTLWSIGYGANWSPLTGVRLIASVVDEQNAPSPQQLGNPVITTPNTRVFDYLRGETVAVESITGGNPLLRANDRSAFRLGLNLQPWSDKDLTFQADYNRIRIDDPIAGFPAATAEIAAAFPDRFTRDAEGRLTRLDARPINFDRQERSSIRYGFNFSKPLRSRVQRQLEAFRAGKGPNPFEGLRPSGGARRQAEAAADAQRPAGEAPRRGEGGQAGGQGAGPGGRFGGGRNFGGGGFGGRGGGGGGRLQFALFHTVNLTERVTVAEGGPVLDLLNGDAIGNNGGQPRHEVEGQAGYTNNGLGARLSLNFRSATEVQGGTAAAPETLEFGSLTTLNLRLFADLGARPEWVRRHPWMRGMRVTVGVDNLFNQRQEVLDQTGGTPINFQPALLDPLGRSVRVSLRKLFF